MKTNLHFFVTPLSFLRIMRKVSDKICTENLNTHFVFSNHFFDKRDIYEIMWKNIVERDRPQMTIRRMRITRWIPKTSITHAQFV